ncbi:MAG: efflux RND transporter periplasmic adaptor subunit [Muribaculaceae bacterium]|nr:efflux RND transporter periplasmic adaptor subunit [Muribaculaceae bacterium]
MRKITSTLGRIASLTGLSAAVALLPGCSGGGAAMPADQIPELAVMTVESGNSDLSNDYAATIKGKVDVDVRPLVSGFVTKVHVDEGQYVKQGQPLFTLDQVTFQAAVEQAQAAVNSAQTAVSSSQLTADNKKLLFDKNIISEYEYQLALNQLSTAKAQLANAQAALTSARKNLSYTVVTAPVSGYVGSIPGREGTLASPSMAQPLTTVSDNSEVYAYFSLTEKDILELTEGKGSLNAAVNTMPLVKLRLADGSVYPIEGKVATVSGVIDSSTGASSVRARFANPDGVLRSGSTGQIIIPNRMDNVISIPQKATYEVQDRRFVYVLNDSNKTVPTNITVSPLNDGKNFIVTGGLQPGQRVVIEGIGTKVQPGMEIKPVDAAAKAAQDQAAAPAAE